MGFLFSSTTTTMLFAIGVWNSRATGGGVAGLGVDTVMQLAISNSDSVATTPIAFLAMITSPSYVDGRNGEIPSSIVALKHGKVLFGNGRGASSHLQTRALEPPRHPPNDG